MRATFSKTHTSSRFAQISRLCDRYTLLNVSADPLWDLAAPRITSTIVGISRLERLAQTVDLARHPIPAGVWADLQAVRPDTDDPEATRWN